MSPSPRTSDPAPALDPNAPLSPSGCPDAAFNVADTRRQGSPHVPVQMPRTASHQAATCRVTYHNMLSGVRSEHPRKPSRTGPEGAPTTPRSPPRGIVEGG